MRKCAIRTVHPEIPRVSRSRGFTPSLRKRVQRFSLLPSFLFFCKTQRIPCKFRAASSTIMPRADCSLSRLITTFARNCDVIRESSGWNFRNAADYSASVLPYTFRVTERCEPYRPRFADVIGKEFSSYENTNLGAIARRDH